MKKRALVSGFCALLFTNVLVGASAKDIEGLAGKCTRGDRKACENLAKIAAEDKDWRSRYAAVHRLTDQALLAKIAIGDKDLALRRVAFDKLTDQAALAKVAVESEAPGDRWLAVYKLTDQALLAKIAVEDKSSRVREIAALKSNGQALAAKIAIDDKDPSVRLPAVRRLTDQALLAKIAVEDKDALVRSAAAGKLTDQALLVKIVENDRDRPVRVAAIAAMDGSNPFLKRLAGNLDASTDDALQSIARIKLAIQEPRIRNRFPLIVFGAGVSPKSQSYRYAAAGGLAELGFGGGSMPGESMSFRLSQAEETLATKYWSTNFPERTAALTFLAASVHGADLLAELFHSPEFTPEDLAELSSSAIPEVRQAAAANLTDQALAERRRLARILADAGAAAGAPKLATSLQPGTYNYLAEIRKDGASMKRNKMSAAVKEEAAGWTLTDTAPSPIGDLVDIQTLDKKTLAVLKRSVKQGPLAIDIAFQDNKATGKMSAYGQDIPISRDVGGPVFGTTGFDATGGAALWMTCLPLAQGYSTTFRDFDIKKQKVKLMQLTVAALESVTVPAGTFDSFKIDISPAEGGTEKITVWVAKDSRRMVKFSATVADFDGATATTELQ